MIDIALAASQFLQAALPTLHTAGVVAATKAVGAAGEDAWKWLKSKLTGVGAAEAIQTLERTPGDSDAQQILQVYIQQAAKRDEVFREDLLRRLAELTPGQQVAQNAIASGVGNTVIQVNAGRDAKVSGGK